MNTDIAKKILEINNDSNLSYSDKLEAMSRIAGNIFDEHVNITNNTKYIKRNQYILEALMVLNNFTSRKWVASNTNFTVVPSAEPIEFSIVTHDNRTIIYSLYNFDQIKKQDYMQGSIEKSSKEIILKDENTIKNLDISQKTLNYFLGIGIDTIDKLNNFDLSILKKQGGNIGIKTIREIIEVLKKHSSIEIDERKIWFEEKNTPKTESVQVSNVENKKIKDYLTIIFNNEILGTPRNMEMFKLRYGLEDNKILTLEDIAQELDITRERVRQVIAKIIRRLKGKCNSANKYQKQSVFLDFYNHLEIVKEKRNANIVNGSVKKDFAMQLLLDEFNSDNLIYWKMLNELIGSCEIAKDIKEIKEEIPKPNFTNFEIKKAILACIREFSNKYGRNGIAKILKGHKLKDIEYNQSSINSKYYGIFEQLTFSCIVSEIDELIKTGLLETKKVSYGHPVLNVSKNYNEDEILKVEELKKPIEENSNSIKEDSAPVEEDNYDQNFLRIMYLIKKHKNVFITGHAGTGKSYILNKIKEQIPKLVITSTTGIAAVNVKGQTLHSWAGVGICNHPIQYTVEKILKKSSLKKQIQKCKILAIDEISMLDIHTFEYVDAVLKQVRSNDEPFGGIQVIFIGDFFQLPPVEKNEEVERKYCFESKLWEDLGLQTIILTKNYRQNEEKLITALANMRTNSLTKDDIDLFKTRECANNSEENILHIFATNYEADNYNNIKFKSIDSPERRLYAIDGVYKGGKLIENPTNAREEKLLKRIDVVCSAEKNISLKIGARVMLLINMDFDKGLINGSCGEVSEFGEGYIKVAFDNGEVAKITKHDFEFYNNEVLIALRRQYPLRLAYGITIHKSQGMSLDKLVVDCSRIFEKGQTYVALSRIKTLQGLYLRNFDPDKVMVDNKVVDFYKELNVFNETISNTSFIMNFHKDIGIKKSEPKSIDETRNENDLDFWVDKIRNIIIENNRWIEIFEIAEIIGVKRHQKLVEEEFNSTIAHLISRFLKREGFVSKRINYVQGGYSIVVAPPGFKEDEIPHEIITTKYNLRK